MDDETGAAAAGGENGPIWSQATAVARRSRRKTLSPSKALGFLAASMDDSFGDDPDNVDIENRPPPGTSSSSMPARRKSGLGGMGTATATTPSKMLLTTPGKKLGSTSQAAAAGTLFHAPVYMTWAKGGGREMGALRTTAAGAFWWVNHASSSSSSSSSSGTGLTTPGGGMRDITNQPQPSRDESSQQMEKGGKGGAGGGGMVAFEAGKVLSASFVWLDSQTPGLSVVLLNSTTEGKQKKKEEEGEEEVVGETRIAFFDFQVRNPSTHPLTLNPTHPPIHPPTPKQGTGAEDAARKALHMLQARLVKPPCPPPHLEHGEQGEGGGETTTTLPPTLPPTSALSMVTPRKEGGEVDLSLLVRRFHQAKPHSFAAKHVAKQVYEATGYPLMSFGVIPAAAQGVNPQPLTPRKVPSSTHPPTHPPTHHTTERKKKEKPTNPPTHPPTHHKQVAPAMREMRAMVLSLEPIIKGMNEVHQKGIAESEARTGARATR